MTVFFLGGGVSRRMWPITQDKLLLPFLGKPMFWHVLRQFAEAKVADRIVILSNNQNGDQLAAIAKEVGISAELVLQPEAKGMGDALMCAKHLLQGEALVVNADDLLEPAVYQEVIKVAQRAKADAVFAGYVVKKYFPGGYLSLSGDRVTGVVEKPGEGNEPSDVVKLVVDYFRDGAALIGRLQKVTSIKDDAYEVALDRTVKEGINVQIARYRGNWQALKYPWHVLEIMEYLLTRVTRHIDKTARVAPSAIIEGPVHLGKGSKVFEGAVIKGPAYLGENCIVGSNTLVRQSMLGDGCVVGFNSEVARSYVGNDSWFHANYVGDAVIEGDFGMGSGAVIANLRLDGKTIKVGEERIDTKRDKLGVISGKNVRLGVNATTMPGVRVGAGSLIGPGVVLSRDIKAASRLVLRQEYDVTENEQLAAFDQFRKKLS